MGWIGVDLDGTLAHYEGWAGGEIGAPVPAMVARVQEWIGAGREVRIMTARVWPGTTEARRVEAAAARRAIEEWCQKHIGMPLPVTNEKDYGMLYLYDDRVVQVERNTGRLLGSEQ